MSNDKPKINKVLCGKSEETLKEYPDNFFDSIITDPPYELNFMSKQWDASGIAYSVELWKEVLRTAKPGAFLFCFGGTRTFHRVACAIEDAGFLIKDQMMWIYGSGFPKSTDISKQIDKEAGAKRKIVGKEPYIQPANGGSWKFSNSGELHGKRIQKDITAPATNAAQQWSGHGTALKPAFEPIIMAMKPIEKGLTYAQNAQKYGVAGLNIDAGRVGTNGEVSKPFGRIRSKRGKFESNKDKGFEPIAAPEPNTRGRWPANVILSHSPDCVHVGTKTINENKQAVWACVSDCPVRIIDTQSGKLKSGDNCTRTKEGFFFEHGKLGKAGDLQTTYGDKGGASRFFYCAKACRNEREAGLIEFVPCEKCGELNSKTHTIEGRKENCIRNTHPTVKPLAIIEYIIKLIKMPEQEIKQIILDPFCGSGTTLVAAEQAGLDYVGIDSDMDSVLIASSRIGSSEQGTAESIIKEKTRINIEDLNIDVSSKDFADLII